MLCSLVCITVLIGMSIPYCSKYGQFLSVPSGIANCDALSIPLSYMIRISILLADHWHVPGWTAKG